MRLPRLPFQRPERKVLVAGTGQAGRTIVQILREHPRLHCQLIGFLDDDPAQQGQIIEGAPVIGTCRDLVPLVEKNGVSEVILAVTHHMTGELSEALAGCRERGVRVILMPHLYEEVTGRVFVEHTDHQWSIPVPINHTVSSKMYACSKRVMDITLGAMGLLLFAVLFPWIALAVYLDSPGPILYTQYRVGKGGQIFRMFKFRSMVPDAEKDGQAVWAEVNDPRVTRVGRFLRASHLDELPQCLNILKGEMSVVGPRPERPEIVEKLERAIPFYRARHAVKPGWTGWAFVKYGYAGSVMDTLIKLQYDLYYIKHRSLYLDLLILLKSLAAVIFFRGR